MARIAGIDLPKNKRGVIGLTYIYGIGRSTSKKILNDNGIDENVKVQDWNDDQLSAIRNSVNEVKTEGQLRSEIQLNIKRLMDLGCYRGLRHRRGLPKQHWLNLLSYLSWADLSPSSSSRFCYRSSTHKML